VNPYPAFVGNILRGEGWFLWLVVARLGWYYWATQEDFDWLCASAIMCMMVMWLFRAMFHHNVIGNATLGAFSAMAFVLLWCMAPDISILALPTMIMAGNRTSVLAAVVNDRAIDLVHMDTARGDNELLRYK